MTTLATHALVFPDIASTERLEHGHQLSSSVSRSLQSTQKVTVLEKRGFSECFFIKQVS